MTNKTWDVLMVAGVLGGCGAADPAPATPTLPMTAMTATAPRAADESLARLRALGVLTVGEMMVERPAEAFNCYGPCPGSEPIIARAELAAAARLDAFVRAADAAVEAARAPGATPTPGACDDAAVDANLAALRALRVVEVRDLVRATPTQTGHCYGVCPADAEAARRVTCGHADELAAIVAAVPSRP
jgi:hypothetical protein